MDLQWDTMQIHKNVTIYENARDAQRGEMGPENYPHLQVVFSVKVLTVVLTLITNKF